MAKIKHNNFLDSVDEVIANAKSQRVIHLYADGKTLHGRKISIDKKEMYHFGTTGYLGLEQDKRLKDAASKAIYDYGTQFPLSKTYISHPLYATLEEKLFQMYGQHIIVTKNSTLGHLAVIPTVVRDEDAVILDHQVHWSVQSAAQLLKTRGIPVEMIRHNDMDMLQSKINALGNKVKNIWYMADGVYSMFGDFAPVEQIKALATKYPQLHLYFDDVHGMSWRGKHGTGFISSTFKQLPENLLLFGTLSKTFGASGAVLVCPNKKLYNSIKNFGGPLTFSAQLEPSAVAAAIASAHIHLSQEIYQLQNQLQQKISHFNQLLAQTDLPLIDKNESPVFYIGTGMPITGYNFVKRLLNEGFFVNLGLFPAVPVKNTGVRITIARHNQNEDIEKLVEAMTYHYPKALEETHTSPSKIARLFKLQSTSQYAKPEENPNIKLAYYNTITNIEPSLWDSYMAKNNCSDWLGIKFQQKTFSNNQEPEHNWQFHFYIVTDNENNPLVITYFTTALWKDDLLAPTYVSEKMEQVRLNDKYYATNWVTAMGSLFSEGSHQYTDVTHPLWKNAWRQILSHLEELAAHSKSQLTVLRDFDNTFPQLDEFFVQQGFVKINMPEACTIQNISWNNAEEFRNQLSPRATRHFKNDIAPNIEKVKVEVTATLSPQTLTYCYDLYKNVKNRNLAVNTFTYPLKVFQQMSDDNNWEFILLYPAPRNGSHHTRYPLGVMFCYKNPTGIYVPSLVGLDYNTLDQYQTYRQLLYQTILVATQKGFKSIDFGISANFEKKKLGASITPLHAFIQAEDNFALERMQITYG